MRTKRVVWFLIMITVGCCAGLYYAWIISPVEFTDATFYHLKQDYKADYVLMAAEVYHESGDLFEAGIWLNNLYDSSRIASIENAIENAKILAYSSTDLDLLHKLYNDMRKRDDPNYIETPIIVEIPLIPTETPFASSAETSAVQPEATHFIFEEVSDD